MALKLVPLEAIPESRRCFLCTADLLLAVSMNKDKSRMTNTTEHRAMKISILRRKLNFLGLNVEGSREILIKRLDEKSLDEENGPDSKVT